jgi:hypothetical protein
VFGVALEEPVALDLVDRRRDLVVLDQVDEPVGIEVRDADCARDPLAVQLLHRAPRGVVVAERMVDQVEVEVVEAETLERGLEGATRGVLALILNPQLRRDEQLVAGDPARLDCPTDSLFVQVRGGGVERAIPGG